MGAQGKDSEWRAPGSSLGDSSKDEAEPWCGHTGQHLPCNVEKLTRVVEDRCKAPVCGGRCGDKRELGELLRCGSILFIDQGAVYQSGGRERFGLKIQQAVNL